MLGYQCLPLLKMVMVWGMLSLFCGSNVAFPVTVLNLLRYTIHTPVCRAFLKSCFPFLFMHVYLKNVKLSMLMLFFKTIVVLFSFHIGIVKY